jgi:DNA end-binding protein Ku
VRSLWKGAIGFGLVHIPCRLFAATEDRDVHFRQLHRACHTPVQYRRTCPHCDVELKAEDIVRGVEVSPDRFVVLEDQDLEGVEDGGVGGEHLVEIQQFVELASVDPLYFQRAYYVGPGDGGARPYALLRAALEAGARAAVATVTLRARRRLALVRAADGCLVLETMRYPDEIRDPAQVPGVPGRAAVAPRELEVALELVQRLSAPWDPARYRDERRAAIEDIVARRGGEAVAPAGMAEAAPALLAALEASLHATEARDGAADGTGAAPSASRGAVQRSGRDGR